jgi:hypothetical protein
VKAHQLRANRGAPEMSRDDAADVAPSTMCDGDAVGRRAAEGTVRRGEVLADALTARGGDGRSTAARLFCGACG